VTDFRKVQPLSGEPGSLPTEAWILATPEGLAIGFHNTQPADVPRTRQRVQRDFDAQVDRVNLNIDFEGAHGLQLTVSRRMAQRRVVTNETQFTTD
jgi:hypothetical protein